MYMWASQLATVSLLLSLRTYAVPSSELQTVLGELGDLPGLSDSVFSDIAHGLERAAHNVIEKSKEKVEQWASDGKEYVKQHDMVCKCPHP